MNIADKPAAARAQSIPAVRGFHHYAYKCKDPEATRAFYEDLLGLPLVHVVEEHDMKTTTGDVVSFAHFFFGLRDGSMIAFFDLGDGRASQPDPDTPAFVNHLALTVDGEDELLDLKLRLEGAGHDVVGPMGHDDFVRSIYFWDPNGIRMEFAYSLETEESKAKAVAEAHHRFERWHKETSPAVAK
ncbi:MAG TPA: VOC family protein [Alphaproteobacteria bacterium]|nr:VOC family protein [Alphaproteobacteria bacterium]